ncbi:hypothetical protein SAMN04488600_102559 [Paenibacillus polymyxa]|nr:hypothetical protein SAMN04488600_102559 [Paenibacillus polymyxa]
MAPFLPSLLKSVRIVSPLGVTPQTQSESAT